MVSKNLAWKSIKDIIAQQTGIEKDEDIEAYGHFCHHAGLNDGVLMSGDIQHEFYEELYRRANKKEKAFQDKVNEDRGNHRLEKGFVSPIEQKAKELMEHYMIMFQNMHLVTEPRIVNLSTTKYPVLVGYNYFNDAQFYRKTESNGRQFVI